MTLGLLGVFSAAVAIAATVDDQVVGSISEGAKYVVSPRGSHLAVVAAKGSRMGVTVDGVAGPRFDQIHPGMQPYIDPRPYEGVDGNSVPQGTPVIFSKDGQRHAYLARLGNEWVLTVDNKEVLRVPLNDANGSATTDFRLEFTGESGAHLLLARGSYFGFELWFDGKKWPGFFGSGGGGGDGTIDPIVSADGEHVAYVAQMSRDKTALIVDGKDPGYFGKHLQFTPDSKHLICVSESPKGHSVLIDGKPVFTARQILAMHVPPAGNRLIYSLMHFSKDGLSNEGTFLMVDGKPVEATLTKSGPPKVIFSPDGKHYAAICGSNGSTFVVIDGKKGQEYFTINDRDVSTLAQGIAFSPDSSRVVYVATTRTSGNNTFVVVNEEESDGLAGVVGFRFSADGKHLAYWGGQASGQKSILVIDGKSQPLAPGWSISLFTFSPDGSRHAYLGQQGGNKGIFLDGKNTNSEIFGDFAFSPDSKHFAIAHMSKLSVDGQVVFSIYSEGGAVQNVAFSPDSQHLYWMTREPAIGAKAGPGKYENVAYASGQAVARCDSIADAPGHVRSLYGFQPGTLWKKVPAWNANAAGKLVFLGPDDDGIKRIAAPPAANTNVDTMIAEAIEAPKRAAAKAAEEKKKADEAKAAKKAKADADAAEAAAKAKADYDAQVAAQTKARADAQAKAKADYDARVAKQKADYEALMAKRKADADAAAAGRKK